MEAKRIDKNGKEITKTMSYKWQFNVSARFMVSPLSNLVDNSLNVNMDITMRNMKHVELNTKIVSAIMSIQALKMIEKNKNACAGVRITRIGWGG